MRTKAIYTLLLLCLCFAWLSSAQAGEQEDKARALLEKYKDSVITVKAVVKQSMSFGGGGHEDENKTELTGTVISPEGMTVVSLSAIDPMNFMRGMFGGMGGEDFNVETEVTDVQFLTTDGTEIPGEILLRDRDLDLAYLRPLEPPDPPMAYIDFTDSTMPDLLDELVVIDRMGEVANRNHALSLDRVKGKVKRPRPFVVPEGAFQGCPALTLDGKVVGLYVLRATKNTGGGGGMGIFSGRMNNFSPIILPPEDILEGAKQAPPFEKKESAEQATESE